MVKSDKWIRRMAKEEGMIEPFEDRLVKEGVISFGLSSYGYDLLFLGAEELCEVSYADRKGKYQRQTGITLPTI